MALSYIAKLGRAKEHLVELEAAIDAYCGSHPYTVRKRIEGKKKTPRFRLEFTEIPADTDIPVIAADAINNLRFCLDHLMCALVPPKERGKVMFPIFFQGVWEAIIPGENQERIKQRMRWASVVKTLPDGAVAILKELQPSESAREAVQPNWFLLLNTWSNRDRHERLPVMVGGLDNAIGFPRFADGTETSGNWGDSPGVMKDGTDLVVPDGTVEVEIKGVPVVTIERGFKNRYVRIPEFLSDAAGQIETILFPALEPFVRADAT